MADSIASPGLSQGNAAGTLDLAKSAAFKPLKTPTAGKTLDPKDVKRTADDFETLFLEQMFNHMFSTIGVDKTTGGGQGEETVRSLLVNAYAKNVVKAGGVGLSASIARDIIKIQEQANAAAQQ